MPLGANNEGSMFPPYKWKLRDVEFYCKRVYHIQPRPHWITTEFGGHVRSRLNQATLTKFFNA